MAQRPGEGAPVHPNEQSAASSPEHAAICPDGQLNQSATKKDTHKKRRDQAFKDFIYQNIFNKDRFTNIFKKKIGHSIRGERNQEDDHSGRNQEDASADQQPPSEDEEYMLFLSYIYNDVASFIELNKNEHLKNSDYADLEDLILEICGTVCRDAFRNIKSIFKSSEGGAPSQESLFKHANHADHANGNDVNGYRIDRCKPDSHGDKGKSEPFQSSSPSVSDSSFFFIPPMESLVTHIHKLTSKKDDVNANNVFHSSSDVNEFLKNNNFDKHPIYGSLQSRGDKPREEAKATHQGEDENLPFQFELPAKRGETPPSLGQIPASTHKAVLQNSHSHSHLDSHPSGYITLEAERSHAHTGAKKQTSWRGSGNNGDNNSCSNSGINSRSNRLRSEVDTYPPTHSQQERLLLEDATEEITRNEKKHDEEGVQHGHSHGHANSTTVEHTQMAAHFDVSSNNARATIFLDAHNFNENETIWDQQKIPVEFTPSLLNDTTRSDWRGAIYSPFSAPKYANNPHSNDGRPNGAVQGNFPPNSSENDDYIDDDVVSVEGKTMGDTLLRGKKFMNGSCQGCEEAHRGIHHYSGVNCSRRVSRSNSDDGVFDDCLDDYVKPARGHKGNQDTDTNDDDSKPNAKSEERDVTHEMEGMASEGGDANGAHTPKQDNPQDSHTTTHADEQTSNSIRREEHIHPCGGQNSDQLEADKEGITTEGKRDSPKEKHTKEQSPKGQPLKGEEPNEHPQRIIQLDQKEYLEKQQKMVKNKTYTNPDSRREFTKNENPHDDYYHFKYLNSCENISNPYQYTKVEKKANIQVTPSPFPQFLRDIQIYNTSQKKIRLKKTNIALRRDDADVGIPEKTTNKKKKQTRKRTK